MRRGNYRAEKLVLSIISRRANGAHCTRVFYIFTNNVVVTNLYSDVDERFCPHLTYSLIRPSSAAQYI